MRVLLINQVFHPDPQATSQYLSRLATELSFQGHEVTVLTGRRDYDDPSLLYPARETWNGIEIIRAWSTGWGHGSKVGRIIDFLSFMAMASLRAIFLKRSELVVALTSPPLVSVIGALLSLLWKARFVYWIMDLNPDEAVAAGWLKADGFRTRDIEDALRWSMKHATQVIVPDIYMRDRLLGKGVDRGKIRVIPLWIQGGVTFDPTGRERFRRDHGLKDKYVVMYAGNHSPCHPLDTLVEAAVLLRDDPRIHFCFIGGGMEWRRLRDRARTEDWRNATFLGYQPEAELSGLLSAADMQVVVMGEPFVGIVHPCKVYNFLAAKRPFIYIGPEQSHIADLIRETRLDTVTIAYLHGESRKLAYELKRRAAGHAFPDWPHPARMVPWTEEVVLKKIISALGG